MILGLDRGSVEMVFFLGLVFGFIILGGLF